MAPESAAVAANDTCTPAFPDKKVTYNNYVKGIIAENCTNKCHVGDASAPGDFRTYSGVFRYADQFRFRVIQDRADMPQGNAPLPKSTRDSLNIWVQNCAPEN
jgi:hypothetical protein